MRSLLACLLLYGRPSRARRIIDQRISGWLASQTNIQTWTADFTQTRALKALRNRLSPPGRSGLLPAKLPLGIAEGPHHCDSTERHDAGPLPPL